jgi:hypothetical protein
MQMKVSKERIYLQSCMSSKSKFYKVADCILSVGHEQGHCSIRSEPNQNETIQHETSSPTNTQPPLDARSQFASLFHFQQAGKRTSSEAVNIGDSLLNSIACLGFNPWKAAGSQWLSNTHPQSSTETPVTASEGGQPPTDEGGRKPTRSRAANATGVQGAAAARRTTRNEAAQTRMRPGVPSQVKAFAQRQSQVSHEETLPRLIAHRERLREERARSLAQERSLYLVRTNPELDFEPFLIIRGEGADGGRARIHFNSGVRS